MRGIALAAARVLYLFSPLLVSAGLSGVVLRFDLLGRINRPIDGGRTLSGRRLFGDGKTWRGAVTAIIGSVIAVLAQKHLIGHRANALALIDYRSVNPVLLGLALGGGAIVGELPNSFVKRRLGIPRGQTARGPLRVVFYLWDQLDLLTGSWPLLLPWIRPSLSLVGLSAALVLAIHPLVALIGYLIGARSAAR